MLILLERYFFLHLNWQLVMSLISLISINNYTTLVRQLWDRTPKLYSCIFNIGTYDITWGAQSPLTRKNKEKGMSILDRSCLSRVSYTLFSWVNFQVNFDFFVFWTKLTWEFTKVTYRDVFLCLNSLLLIWTFSNSYCYVTFITFTSHN